MLAVFVPHDTFLSTAGVKLSGEGRPCPRCITRLNKELLELDDELELKNLEERALKRLATKGMVTPAGKAARQMLVDRKNGLRLVGRSTCDNCFFLLYHIFVQKSD